MDLQLKEMREAHEKLKEQIYKGREEINFRAFAEIYDNHTRLLEAYQKLESAFLAFHELNEPEKYYLRFQEKTIDIMIHPEFTGDH